MPAAQPKRASDLWPWKLWSAIVVIAGLYVAACWMFKSAIEFSHPELSYHDATCVAQFEATNHTNNRMDAEIRVILGNIVSGSKTKHLGYTEFAHKTLSVSFMPREKKSLVCEITMPSSSLRGNDVRIEVESFVQSTRRTPSGPAR